MKDKKILIIVASCIALFVITATCLILFQGKIKKNPPGTIGNTAGNLNNGGTFCESDGKVYFANPYDQNMLYSMSPDETGLKKLSNSQPQYLNVGGKYLYYYQVNTSSANGLGFMRQVSGIYRSTINGKKSTCLKREPAEILTLVDNSLFYQHYNNKKPLTLYRINTDKTKDMEVAPYIINPASVQDGYIYFNGTKEDHSLYRLNTADNFISLVWQSNIWNPVIQGDYVYYMDVSNNYRLCRYSLSGNTVEILTHDRVDTFNVTENYIYYQKNSTTEPALKRILLDGSQEELIRSGNHEKLQITSTYLYFNEFNNPTPLYKTPVSGPVNVEIFQPIKQ